MTKYKPTIGLEIHAELKTKTKMFCNSINDPDEVEPNVNVCPVCMAHPGTLPVINKEAVKSVIKVGVALGGKIASFTEFDRKNYFYPDIPKGYQISQYAYPIVSGGALNGVSITRIHLEEDTAKSSHDSEYSLVDFNRAGVPLMELVTEPVIHSAEEAGAFARELQLLLRYLGVSEANMEKGEMRVEVNISVSKNDVFGTKVEIKNINSFRSAERGIEYEIKRQTELLELGQKVIQETRGWDEMRQVTFSQRIKETSDDYRYFPDPDLPKLKLDEVPEFDVELIKSELPELPPERRAKYISLGLKKDDANMYTNQTSIGDFMDGVLLFTNNENEIKIASNYISSDLVGLFKDGEVPNKIEIDYERFVELVRMIIDGKLSSRGAKEVLRIMYEKGGIPQDIAEENSLIQVSDIDSLGKIVGIIIDENKDAVDDYRSGKEASLRFLVGQGMKLSKGSADPAMLEKMIRERLQN
ncbi:Asp-tRNA(Asn)/Glu-tRNA(Gln) amidotransferase GatCAB subunit B [Candidatus Campbellbacteria bacterium CG22_combo_CG10-13_8_21_14_all_36_13]|uniref:Aspartyl/glutamyl-tRNA(Asn/Gln) amidotransferase subunit B n=1 Tax=Candidatus Campbellbacteria bacterium CG22_combo_CG10-13_8_21_14_all_36_13 TaxID=1974529 RepID=A0A2H0DY34_9BACT|nr:MAG: Asp-tRNA(Asn)/Glu-tRNA(Gln) amidotransferase GatCAB subunit B [Candidatus Campbellbacteria bacterium CG22_combo_CG10-13_8_21_14_all_36_13]